MQIRNKHPVNSKPVYHEVITSHINADFDALASMIAASKLYPKAALVFPGSQEKNLHNFFIQSASYLFNFLKVKNIDLNQIERLILVDTRQKSRIGKFAELADKEDVEIHIYDHHPDSDDDIHGTIEVINNYGAATTILTKIIKEKGLALTPDEATIMCLGIHEDTGSFTFSSTTPDDYLAAGWLAEQGAKHDVITDLMAREISAEHLWLLNDLTKSATTRIINSVEVVIAKIYRDEYIGDFAGIIHKFMDMKNLKLVFVIAQMESRIHFIARSRLHDINVAEIAMHFGGGGHAYAASATIKNKTMIQVERSLLALLRTRIIPGKLAKDLMSSPAISITGNENIKHAKDMLTRYNINVLLIINQKGHLNGYITRQIVEKAVFFSLSEIKVKDYMNVDFTTIHPDSSLKDIQELIVRNRLRILPVVENEKVIGVITRTDILNILMGEPLLPEALYKAPENSSYLQKKNLSWVLKERLPGRMVKLLKDLGYIADILGYGVYLVGGLVRDVFLNHKNLDVDIVVEGDGIKFAYRFAELHEARVRSYRKFRTAVIIFSDGFKVDVATARREYYEFPGALPIVENSSLKMDLYRRDFTINTLAIKLNKKDYGTLIDYFNGQRDIKEKTLRVLHNLSFVEDPTRILRAIRFEIRFGFRIGKVTLALIKNAVKIDCFKELANQRFLQELKLILKEKYPIKAIKRMDTFNLLQFISPEIKLTKGLRLLLEEIKRVISWYELLYLEKEILTWKIYWLGLVSSLGSDSISIMTKKMGVQGLENQKLTSQIEELDSLYHALLTFGDTNYILRMILQPYDPEILLYLMARSKSNKIKKLISIYYTKLISINVELTGKDLLTLGLKQGPLFKEVFKRLLEAKLNDEIKTKEDEIKFVKTTFQL